MRRARIGRSVVRRAPSRRAMSRRAPSGRTVPRWACAGRARAGRTHSRRARPRWPGSGRARPGRPCPRRTRIDRPRRGPVARTGQLCLGRARGPSGRAISGGRAGPRHRFRCRPGTGARAGPGRGPGGRSRAGPWGGARRGSRAGAAWAGRRAVGKPAPRTGIATPCKGHINPANPANEHHRPLGKGDGKGQQPDKYPFHVIPPPLPAGSPRSPAWASSAATSLRRAHK